MALADVFIEPAGHDPLVANFVIVPAVAVAIAKMMSLSEPQAVGLILLGAAAGAPFLPKLVGGQNYDDPNVAILVIVVALLSLLLLAPPAVAFGRHRSPKQETQA